MKHLNDIEQHARELAGGEFGVCGKSRIVLFCGAEHAAFDSTGMCNLHAHSVDSRELPRLTRFVSLCSELDTWIKGDTK